MNRQNILLVAAASISTALAMLALPAAGQLVQEVVTQQEEVSGPRADPCRAGSIIESAAYI